MSHDELFALFERESRRPGCQFGVLLRLMRQDKVLGVYWVEKQIEEKEEVQDGRRLDRWHRREPSGERAVARHDDRINA